MAHNAGWHKTCHLKCNKTKLEHLQGKSTEVMSHTSSAVHTHILAVAKLTTQRPPIFSVKHQQALHISMNVPPMILILVSAWRCVMELEDTAPLAKLAPGDLIALEAKYHRKCLPKLNNRTRATDSTGADLDVDANLHGIGFSELVAYMEDFCVEECVIPSYLMLHTCTKFVWHSWVLILKVTSTLPDLKSEHSLCSLISGHICNGDRYLSHSLMILVMFLGRPVIMIVTQCFSLSSTSCV